MDPLVLKYLISAGIMTAEGVVERPSIKQCKRCGAHTVAALEGAGPSRKTTPGVEVRCDPRPLTPAGEMLAMLSGLSTFRHLGNCLLYRSTEGIRARSADRHPVLAEHRCGTVLLYHPKGAEPRLAGPRLTARPRPDYDGPIPF